MTSLVRNHYASGIMTTGLLLTVTLIMFGIMIGAKSVMAQDATPTSITLYWTAPGDDGDVGTATVYDIRYSTSPIDENNWDNATQVTGEAAPQPAGSQETYTVEGLEPSTTYYFAIMAADEVPNWSTLSNIVAKTTLDEQTAPVAVADLNASDATSTTITLTWSAPGDDGSTGTASEYDIRYSTSPIDAFNWDDAVQLTGEPAPQPAGSLEMLIIGGLEPSTTYYFALKTADEVPNWSGLSNVASTMTGDEQDPPGIIADLNITDVTPSSVTLAWTAPGDDGNSGTASQYDIRYATWPITDTNWAAATQVISEPAPQPAGSAESFTIADLDPSTTYYFVIRTADEVPNWSDLSNIAQATTVDNVPPAAIDDLAASSGDYEGELTLRWTAPGDDGYEGIAGYYVILYSLDTIDASNWEQADLWVSPPSPLPAGQEQIFTLTDLQPGKEYWVAIKTVDDAFNISELSNCTCGEAKFEFSLDADDEIAEVPTDFRLAQNYPNPFNPSTTIEYSVPVRSNVAIRIYNVLGQLTATLVDEPKAAGNYAVDWGGIDDNGLQVASGVYLYRIEANGFNESKKMLLLQ
ncbi:MAG: fibronectin type III domain-containing protein [Candidatus Zixiibacteriota bacterium]|nr:MAG: fibronectin type III domain-containing protein [candidate division Zixibacteria bacterium]